MRRRADDECLSVLMWVASVFLELGCSKANWGKVYCPNASSLELGVYQAFNFAFVTLVSSQRNWPFGWLGRSPKFETHPFVLLIHNDILWYNIWYEHTKSTLTNMNLPHLTKSRRNFVLGFRSPRCCRHVKRQIRVLLKEIVRLIVFQPTVGSNPCILDRWNDEIWWNHR